MLIFLQKDGKLFCGLDDLLSYFEDIFKYFGILEGRYSDVIVLRVKDDLLWIGRYGNHFDIFDLNGFFDMVVINEVESLTGHS